MAEEPNQQVQDAAQLALNLQKSKLTPLTASLDL
jgi:hypothetical protein